LLLRIAPRPKYEGIPERAFVADFDLESLDYGFNRK